MSKKSYAVLGLGRYGMAVAKELVASGEDVLAVDVDQTIVNAAALDIPYCKCADITDFETIKQLGIGNMDVVIIAMANNLEASVLATMLCKEIGVKQIVAKCADEMHCKILSKVGADQVVFPEFESGTRLAKNLISSGFVDVMDLSHDASILEIEVKSEWAGKSLIELNLRKKYSINIVAIRKGDKLQVDIDPAMPITTDMSFIVIGNPNKLGNLR